MNQKLLAEYVDLQKTIDDLTAKKDALRVGILDGLKKENIEKLKDDTLGTFSVAHRSSWKYSPAVTKLEEKVKIAKNKEQEKGLAKETVSEHLLYTPIKEK